MGDDVPRQWSGRAPEMSGLAARRAAQSPPVPPLPTPPGGLTGARRRGDTAFALATRGASLVVLALIGAILAFLVVEAVPALRQAGWHFFTHTQWFPDAAHPRFGVAALAWGTVLSSAVALVIAVPVAVATALYLTQVAPPRAGRYIGYVVDLLAAVPSVVYGLWGVAFLAPHLIPFERALSSHLGFIPFFANPVQTFGRSIFAASVVLAIMVLPIVTAVSREVFRQVPRADTEAALALGATRWETIRMAVLPPSRNGIIGAAMLGLGRALGETIAIALVLASSFTISIHLFQPGGNTIAANIANQFGEAGTAGRHALVASGLVLFVISIIVNLGARAIASRSVRSRRGTAVVP